MKIFKKKIQKGLTILELLIVIVLIVILGTTGIGFYRNYVKTIEIESTAETIISDLKTVREKSMSGENDLKWGIHFVNGENDYYQIFSTATDFNEASIITTIFLPSSISFFTPTEGQIIDVIFNKISGITTSTSIVIFSEGKTKTININNQGNVF